MPYQITSNTEEDRQSGVHPDTIPSRIIEANSRVMEQMLQYMMSIDPQYPIDPYSLFDEELFAPTGSSSGIMSFNIDRPVLISSMMISIPGGTTGLLTIGTRINMPIQTTWLNPTGIAMIVYPTEQAKLVLTGGTGIIWARFMGNSLRNDKWRRL